MILSKEFRFEASHQLHNHPGKCARLHGHSWKLIVTVEGPIHSDTGMVMDYGGIKEVVQPLVDRLDHRHLGHGEYFSWDLERYVTIAHSVPNCTRPLPLLPTSENLLIWIAGELSDCLPWIQLQLQETCTSEAVLTRDDYEENYAKASHSKGERTEDTQAAGRGEEAQEGEVSQ